VAGVVLLRTQQPVLVISPEADNFRPSLASKREDGVDTPSCIGSSVDVVPEKHQDISLPEFVAELAEQVDEGREIPVDVPDGYSHLIEILAARPLREKLRDILADAARVAHQLAE
jgi:hypothetical protein